MNSRLELRGRGADGGELPAAQEDREALGVDSFLIRGAGTWGDAGSAMELARAGRLS